jgi:hypothetical protein
VIVVKTKAGVVWNVTAFDTVTVRVAGGATAEFQVADLAEILVDAVGAQLSLLDGSNEDADVRALHVGEKMAEGKIIVTTTMPQGR